MLLSSYERRRFSCFYLPAELGLMRQAGLKRIIKKFKLNSVKLSIGNLFLSTCPPNSD
ncbi:MAG: hypothetical protein KJ666_03990 [Bacteroidetes bacterium]|nr:hypothetical protein [Bacteroidota bacterium]